MSTDLVLRTTDAAFSLAERINRSSMVPSSYRGKPLDLAVALLFGAEIGLPPMATMNRVVVVEGKPALDAQGIVAVVRAAGHSISGETSSEKATVRGKRRDTGDEMSVTFTMEDARRAGLASKAVWKAYPTSMLWARALSQLARMLFADCLMGFSYVPEEADFDGKLDFDADGRPVNAVIPSETVQPVEAAPSATRTVKAPAPHQSAPVVDAEVVGEAGRPIESPQTDANGDPVVDAEVVGEVETSEAAAESERLDRLTDAAADGVDELAQPDGDAERITQRDVNKLRTFFAKTLAMTDDAAQVAFASAAVGRPLGKLKDLAPGELASVMQDPREG